MHMIISISTYTLALFEVAEELGKAKSFYNELQSFNEILKEDQEINQTLTYALKDYRVFDPLWNSLKAYYSVEVVNFLKIIHSASLMYNFEQIIDDYRDLLKEHGYIYKVDIASPEALSTQEQASIISQIKKHYPKDLDVRFKVDPSLMHGLYVRVNNDIYDTSVKKKLAQILYQGGQVHE